MTYAIRSMQARCAALGFYPGPIDGINGTRTAGAHAQAVAAQRAKGRSFEHPTGLTRIHWHWTGGHYIPNADDRKHYHFIIDGDGNILSLHDPRKRLSHTLNANGGAIAVSLACMALAEERPFKWGPAPMLARQVSALSRLTADLCREFDIPVSRFSTLSHAEVQPTLGIKQKQKWDIAVLPGMEAPADPVATCDRVRQMVARDLKASQGV